MGISSIFTRNASFRHSRVGLRSYIRSVGLALRQRPGGVPSPEERPRRPSRRKRPAPYRRLGGQNQLIIAIVCKATAEKLTCRRLSRYSRQVSSPAPLGRSSTQSLRVGLLAFLRRSRASLGWGGDKAHYSNTTVIWKVLCQRRSGAVSGPRERLEGPDARIQPQQRSESRQLPTTQTEDLYRD